MFDEDFKLNKTNIIFIVVLSLMIVLLIIVSVFLIKSLTTPNEDLPYLETTKGKTSTLEIKSTTITTITTTVSTTTKAKKSPYYEVDSNKILSNELFNKQKLTREEATIILTEAYDFLNKFYNISDNSLFDIESTINYAKNGEKDKILINNNYYGEIYNYESFIDKVFSKTNQYMITGFKYDGAYVIVKENNKYYRLENKIENVYPVFAALNVNRMDEYKIEGSIRYYMSNYKEEGYTSPVYKTSELILTKEDNRWKVSKYTFPLYS